MPGRFNLEKPHPVWKHRPKTHGFGRALPNGQHKDSYLDNDSARIIVALHDIERQVRAEIEREQITHWTQAQILARWKDGRA